MRSIPTTTHFSVPGNASAAIPAAPLPEKGDKVYEELARFRYALRKFLRFSETAAREFGVTPQQHQLMLGVAGFTGRGAATVSELAEFLQERNHSVVGLVERAEHSGLVQSAENPADRRVVVVTLTRRGREILAELSRLHRDEVSRMRGLIPELGSTRKMVRNAGKRTA